MNAKKKLSEMRLEELYAEEKMLIDTFFNLKSLLVHLFIVILSISMAFYAMKDTFSYILAGIILFMTYSFLQKNIYKNQIEKEIKSRNS